MLLRPSSFASFSMRDVVFLCLLGAALVNCSFYTWDGPGAVLEEEHADPDACLTDHASCGCCLMQQQLSRMETFFNMSLNTLQKDLEYLEGKLSDFRATRSAFSAALMDSTDRCMGPLSDVTAIVYEHVFLNLGGNYNTATGEFTAPHSGVYSFSLTVYSDAGANGATLAACASLFKNSEMVAGPSDRNRQDQEDSSTTVVALHLNAGDKVHVKLPVGCFLCDNHSHYNTFTGFLLYATD